MSSSQSTRRGGRQAAPSSTSDHCNNNSGNDSYSSTSSNADNNRHQYTALSVPRTIGGELSTFKVVMLTICFAGAQFVWTIELAYGSPYLISLGLPKPLMALVWLAGPLSGLLVQPLIGAYSDSCRWKHGRRRPFLWGGTALVIISVLIIAYAHVLVDLMLGNSASNLPNSTGGMNAADENAPSIEPIPAPMPPEIPPSPTPSPPPHSVYNQNTVIALCVLSFYVLDFSINAAQASMRALLMDVAALYSEDSRAQDKANLWAGRMIGIGNVMGYLMGFVQLDSFFHSEQSQLQLLCLISVFFFGVTVLATSVYSPDYPSTAAARQESLWEPILNVWKSFKHLPINIQRLCNIQFWAWLGWFPFLFYNSSWVAEISKSTSASTDKDILSATRDGSFALLLFAITSLVTGVVAPYIATKFSVGLNRIWTFSHVWFALCMIATGWAHSVASSIAVVMAVGISWGVSMWVPFTLLGEEVGESTAAAGIGSGVADEILFDEGEMLLEEDVNRASRPGEDEQDWLRPSSLDVPQQRNSSEHRKRNNGNSTNNPRFARSGAGKKGNKATACTGSDNSSSSLASLLPRHRIPENSSAASQTKPAIISTNTPTENSELIDAGMVLGIHNIYVVLPQFFATFASSVIFSLFSGETADNGPAPSQDISPMEQNITPFVWVLRFGSLGALVAAWLSLSFNTTRAGDGVRKRMMSVSAH